MRELNTGVSGTIRLNVPVSAARLVLPHILPGFLAAQPGIRVEIVAEDGFVDVLAAGCDAGIHYDERLEQDIIAVPIDPRVQRFASGRLTSPWDFERDGEIINVEPQARLTVGIGCATDLGVDATLAGTGIIHLFEDWLRHLASKALEPVLPDW